VIGVDITLGGGGATFGQKKRVITKKRVIYVWTKRGVGSVFHVLRLDKKRSGQCVTRPARNIN